MKKLLSIILVLALVFSLNVTAFAADSEAVKGSIIINDAEQGQTYSIYKILDLYSSKSTDDDTAYEQFVYITNTTWADFIRTAVYDAKDENTEEDDVKYFTVTTIGTDEFVTWNTTIPEAEIDEAAKTLAKRAKAYADEKNIEAVASKGADSATVEFTDLELGYYLLDSTAGILCTLDTTEPDVEIEEKNGVPSITKEVQEDLTKTWGDKNDAQINQSVFYKATVYVKTGAQKYKVHDRLSKGLTYKGIVSVEIGDITTENSNETFTKIDDVPETAYIVTVFDENESGNCDYTDVCTFEIAFNDDYLQDNADKEIVITYEVVVNENAVIEAAGNANDIYLEYGDENKTVEDSTVTYVHKFKLNKVDGSTGIEKDNVIDYTNAAKIDGAQFKLFDAKTEGNEIPVVKLEEGRYRVAVQGETGVVIETVNGAAEIEGFDSEDTYYIEEIKAPEGYNKLKDRIEVKLANDRDATDKTVEIYTVANNPGLELPSTGGMGTTVFYVIGGIMTAGALVVLVARKRMGEAE